MSEIKAKYELVNQTGRSLWVRVYHSDEGFTGRTLPANETHLFDQENIKHISGLYWKDGDAEVWKPSFSNVVNKPNGAKLILTDIFGPRLASSIKVLIICLADPADPRLRNDIDMEKLFLSAGVPRENVTTLLEHQATAEASMAAIKASVRACKPGDVFFFYMGSHGSDAEDEYWMTLSDGHLQGTLVAEQLAKCKADILLSVDSCHSGKMLEKLGYYTKTKTSEEFKALRGSTLSDEKSPAKIVAAASTQANNTAQSQWNFVRLLLEGLRTDRRYNIESVAQYVVSTLKTPKEDQVPQIGYYCQDLDD